MQDLIPVDNCNTCNTLVERGAIHVCPERMKAQREALRVSTKRPLLERLRG